MVVSFLFLKMVIKKADQRIPALVFAPAANFESSQAPL